MTQLYEKEDGGVEPLSEAVRRKYQDRRQNFEEGLKQSLELDNPIKALKEYHPLWLADQVDEQELKKYDKTFYEAAKKVFGDSMSSDDAIFGTGKSLDDLVDKNSQPQEDQKYKILQESTTILDDDRLRQVRQYQKGDEYGIEMRKFNIGGNIDEYFSISCNSYEKSTEFFELWYNNLQLEYGKYD